MPSSLLLISVACYIPINKNLPDAISQTPWDHEPCFDTKFITTRTMALAVKSVSNHKGPKHPYLSGKNLVIGNIGDSRAVLATRGEDDSLTAVQLTVDLKPDLPESDIDQFEAYYQVVGGEKKRRVFGLGSEAKGYYGKTLCVSCGKTSSSASHELCLAFAIFGIVDDVDCFNDSWLMFGTMDVLDIIICLDIAMFGIVDV
ncbi:putative protein phosphatase 2C 18 [Capsicum chinense]|nr:putative protein phosphatase 2C 18 [Capsicum chinense]